MSVKAPKVSIGMPVYNMENTVQEAINTILNQTFSDFELIISDNASDDGTGEICQAAAQKDSRITYHRNPHNIVGENFKLVFLLSKGEYFMWAAADDARRPEMVERCVEVLDKDPDTILAYTYTELLDPQTNKRRPYCDSYRLDQDDPVQRYKALLSFLDLGNMIYGLYRKKNLYGLPLVGNNFSRLIIFSDALYLTNIVLSGKVVQIPELLFIRRRTQTNKTWQDNLANIETAYSSMICLTSGVTLPVSESIQEHIRYLLSSNLPKSQVSDLIEATYSIYNKRFGDLLFFEISRAADLAKQGKFMEGWAKSSDNHPDKNVQEQIDRFYAGLLLETLEKTSLFIHNNKELYLGKAFCLKKIGREAEATLQFELAENIT